MLNYADRHLRYRYALLALVGGLYALWLTFLAYVAWHA